MATMNKTGRTDWAGPTWRIYAASAGLEDLIGTGKAPGFMLERDGSSYFMRSATTNGLTAAFKPLGLMTPSGTESVTGIEVKLSPFEDDSVPQPRDQAVRAYWDLHETFSRLPELPNIHCLVGQAEYKGEEHTVRLYLVDNVLKDPDKSLLVIRFKGPKYANPDGWAVGHN